MILLRRWNEWHGSNDQDPSLDVLKRLRMSKGLSYQLRKVSHMTPGPLAYLAAYRNASRTILYSL